MLDPKAHFGVGQTFTSFGRKGHFSVAQGLRYYLVYAQVRAGLTFFFFPVALSLYMKPFHFRILFCF